jgi:mono/diheme cytochrome c family protein
MMMRAAAFVIVLVCSVACGGEEKAAAPAAHPAPSATVEPKPVPAPTPAPAPAAAAKPDAKVGEALYVTNCASCHGPRGAGDGPAGLALVPKPARHDDGAYMNALSNAHLFKVIQQGGPAVGKSPLMAPWGGVLSEAQIWDVVAYVRTLANPPYTGTVP